MAKSSTKEISKQAKRLVRENSHLKEMFTKVTLRTANSVGMVFISLHLEQFMKESSRTMSTMEKANSFQTIKMSTTESLLKAKRTVVEPKNIIMGTDIKEGGSMMREVDLVLSLTPKRNKREPEIGL